MSSAKPVKVKKEARFSLLMLQLMKNTYNSLKNVFPIKKKNTLCLPIKALQKSVRMLRSNTECMCKPSLQC